MRHMPHSCAVAVLFCAVHAGQADAAATVTEQTIEGQPAVVLENQFVRLVFTPGKGGECTDFIYKPTGKRLILRREGSLLGNRVWNYADGEFYKQWQHMAWEHEIERRPGEVRIIMRGRGKVDFSRACYLEKSVTLRDGEAMLRAKHTFHVGQELMNPRKIGLWFFNRVGVPNERTYYNFPLDDGITTMDSLGGTGEGWFYNPSRGWAACVGESGTGLCFNMEFRRLMCFYLFPGKQPTFEWAFRTIDIKNGDSFSTDELIVPFAGIKMIHGGGAGVVAGFDSTLAEDNRGVQGKALLTAGTPLKGDLRIALRPLPEGADLPAHSTTVSLEPGRITEVKFSARVDREGTWMLVGTVVREGKEVMDFMCPIVVGKEGAPVRIPPKEERLGRKSERFQDRVPLLGSAPKDLSYSTEIETPHVKWAKPYVGGKLKVLVLTSCLTGREAAELAQRLDMEIIWVTAGSQYELGRLGYLYGRGKQNSGKYLVEHMNDNIKQALTTHRCDAAIIGSLQGSLFNDEVLALFHKQVAEGMGLVYVTPNRGTDELYSLLPVEKEKHLRHRNGQWAVKGPHFITAGVPFDVLPKSDYARYEPQGDVLATAGRYPLIVAQDGPGEGRVVVFSYNTGWQSSGNYSSGMTPWIESAGCAFDYWEYYYSMLAKAIVWSARKEPRAQLTALTTQVVGGTPEALMTFENSGAVVVTSAAVKVSDAYGRVEHEGTQEARIASGESTLRLKLPESLPGGLHLVDVIMKNADGKVVAWGSAGLRLERAVTIESIDFDKRAYYPGDTALAAVTLKAGDGQARSVALDAQFTDALGRVVAGTSRHVDVAGQERIELSLPVGRPLATTAALRVTAAIDGQPAAVAQEEIITFPERFAKRSWDDWHHAVWGSAGGAYGRDNLLPIISKRLKDFGISTCLASSNWQFEREFERQVRSGFQLMPMGVGFGFINVGHRAPKGKMGYKEQATNYQKTHDTKYLVRPVSLSDPNDLEPLVEKLHRVAEYAGWLEPIGYNLGDEMSTTHYVTPFDYDFGPAALEAFREWLKGEYGSLDALNRQWGTTFASWEAVVPMTAHEVRGRGNYAPWADHRAFMDVTFCRFFAWTREHLRARDPKAGVGMSGSQAAEAYGGYNWRLLARTLDFGQTYTHQNTEIMHRSFGPDLPRAPWHGYGGFNPSLRCVLWWRLLSGNYGGSYFALGSIFKPDLTYGLTASQMAPIIKKFQGGVAKLLRNCRRVSDIGVHYSHASIRGAFISGSAVLFRENRAGWIKAMENGGFQCEFLARPELETGELTKRNYSAFILPYSVAISAKEAAALRQYVEQGGLLIADAKAGLMDEHCTSLNQGLLDDLFGISRAQPDPLAPSREGDVRFTEDLGKCQLKGLAFDISVAEPGLRLSDGEALGSHGTAPVAVVRRVGKGAAVFLNLYFDAYFQRSKLGIEAPMQKLASNLLGLQAIAPAVQVEATGDPAPKMFTVRYTSGDALYVGTVMHYGKREADWSTQVKVTFPRPGHVYDLRKGQALGHTQQAERSLLAGDALLYAVMPYRVTGVSVSSRTKSAKAGGTVAYDVAVQAEGGTPGMHVILVDVVGPGGKALDHYATKLVTRDGKATGQFDTALNDLPGRWNIRATDFVSKVVGEGGFELVR